jgi:hypothetical protein
MTRRRQEWLMLRVPAEVRPRADKLAERFNATEMDARRWAAPDVMRLALVRGLRDLERDTDGTGGAE